MSVEGPLSKWTNMIQGWQFRWFVLDTHHGTLSYFISKENMEKNTRRGCINLSQAFVGYDDEDDITFTITVDDKTFHMQARNLDEREKWVSVIEKTIRQHSIKKQNKTLINNSDFEETDTEQDVGKFDSNLVELDAYLQLLIEQQKDLEEKKKKIDQAESDELEKLESVIKGTQSLVETIKHAIVCLQISKVNCDPTNGFHTNHDLNQILAYFHSISIDSKPNSSEASNKQENIESSSDELNNNESIINQQIISRKTSSLKRHAQPLVSFSSSDEDEDDNNSNHNQESEEELSRFNQSNASNETEDNESFYDAIDPSISSDVLTNEFETKKIELPKTLFKEISNINEDNNKNVFETFDYDQDYKDDDIDLDNQQSVITHLLTQVRIGMDLTKITLPTFILETRSLLEMYADFFAYTELFLQIPEIQCPYERMKQVVKWYMSTFRAGRKSPVAKKPYNPILGEIFQCWYNTCKNSDDKELVADGPINWANRDQLTFIAEQVSHHPPISAFYAEHYNKKIQLDGYTWTKSKFLGLSIGVHMIGKAVLSLIEFEEEYILTFPSAYGRSILTVPWFEMGGQVTITCAKSGYSANIDFLTKPFYGGKKHQIQGQIQGPDKKVLNTIEGDWNGTMFIKTVKKIELFINTNSMNIVKKQLRAISEQNDFESRKLWREVTYYLRKKQIDLATNAKQQIEQKQREGVKKRKETNTKWKTKYFHEQGEHWIYINPLSKRLSTTSLENSI